MLDLLEGSSQLQDGGLVSLPQGKNAHRRAMRRDREMRPVGSLEKEKPLAELLEDRMDELLALQKHMDRNVSELVSGLLHGHQSGSAGDQTSLGLFEPGGTGSSLDEQPPLRERRARLTRSSTSSISLEGSATDRQKRSTSSVVPRSSTTSMEDGLSMVMKELPTEARASQKVNSTRGASGNTALAPCFASSADLEEEELEAELCRLLGEAQTGHQTSLVRYHHTGSLKDGKVRSYIMDPHCKRRLTHDLLSIIVLGADFITIPVILAWDIVEEGFLRTLRTFSFAFWTFDMGLNFITGYYEHGELESRKWQIAKRYLKSWFALDIGIVLIDVMFFLLDGLTGKGATILRAGKAVRLIRLVRGSGALGRVAEASLLLEVGLEMVKPASVVIFVSHVFACMWWSISTYMEPDTGQRWVMRYPDGSFADAGGSGDVSFADAGLPYQYLTCIHWSISQLTLGSMDVAPTNAFERAFTCIALLAGVFAFSTLISWLSAEMMRYYLKQNDKLAKLASLRRFLVRRVRPGICIAAQFQAKLALSSNTGKPDTIRDVAAVAVLPQAVQRKIREELCCKHFRHPLLRWWYGRDSQGVKALCHNAVDFVGLAEQDHLFFPRTNAVGAYVMTSGTALYTQESEAGHRILADEVLQGRFFCEAALWCTWKHVGELTASGPCELLSLTPSGLFQSLDEDRISRHVVLQYARRYHQRLTALLLEKSERPNDITVPFTQFDSILSSLPASCRELIGAVAVCVAKQQKGRSYVNETMVEEVRAGKCCLMVNWTGEVERIVAIVVLRLVSRDGRVLAQIAEWKGEAAQVSCKLPGKKLREGQDTDETLTQLIDNGMCAPFGHHIQFTGADLEVAVKQSTRMETKTKYLKHVHHAELNCPATVLDSETTRVDRSGQLKTRLAERQSWQSESSTGSRPLDMFVLADGAGQITLASWLTIPELQYFTGPEGEECLKGMLEQTRLDPEAVEGARERYQAATSLEDDSGALVLPEESVKDLSGPFVSETLIQSCV